MYIFGVQFGGPYIKTMGQVHPICSSMEGALGSGAVIFWGFPRLGFRV